jgi:hypothetical protein
MGLPLNWARLPPKIAGQAKEIMHSRHTENTPETPQKSPVSR